MQADLNPNILCFQEIKPVRYSGYRFLKEQKAHVDYDKDILQMQGGLVVAKMFSCPHKSGLARLINRISIPPQSATVARVKVRNSSIEGMILIEPIRTLPSKHQVIGACSVTHIQNDQTFIQILNPTHEWVYLKADEPVARVDSLENSAILCEIDDSPSPCVPDIMSQNTQSHTGNTKSDTDNTQSNSSNTHSSSYLGTQTPSINELQTDSHDIEIANLIGVDLLHSTLSEEQKNRLLMLIGKKKDVFGYLYSRTRSHRSISP